MATETKQGSFGGNLPRVLFVCVENSCRSQISEAFAHIHGRGVLEGYSSGSNPCGKVSERAIELMQELGYDMQKQGHRSKDIAEVVDANGHRVRSFEYVITMGCGDKCPVVSARFHEDWNISDPKHVTLEEARKIRAGIEERIKELVDRVKKARSCQSDKPCCGGAGAGASSSSCCGGSAQPSCCAGSGKRTAAVPGGSCCGGAAASGSCGGGDSDEKQYEAVHEQVRHYYGQVLQKSEDLQSCVCVTTVKPPEAVLRALERFVLAVRGGGAGLLLRMRSIRRSRPASENAT